ncbi:MAG: ribonuclease D, partial [Acidobacteriota bacterium]
MSEIQREPKMPRGMDLREPEFEWIDDDARFRVLVLELRREDVLALDTESDGFHHYFDKLCLLQISTKERHFIVDILALSSLEPLGPLLADRAIRKVLHAADQDLMYFARDHHLTLAGLFDTSLAAMLLGHTRLGLASLLQEFFGIKLSKSSQRDDWSARPLSRRQLAYAIADTSKLLDLARHLEENLEAAGRLDWAEEEFRALEEKKWTPPKSDPGDLSRIKGWRDLDSRGQNILRELLLARDREARRRDRPPFRVAGNTLLLALAAHPPQSAADFSELRGM